MKPVLLIPGVALVLVLGLGLAGTSGCSDGAEYAQAVCVLTDTSGTYADQTQQMRRTIRQALLPRMLPGDSLILVRIDANSYEQDNVEGVLTLDRRRSVANTQKLQLAKKLMATKKHQRRARHTDISGGMMLCGEYLAETNAGQRVIVVFSDMKEELPRGTRRVFSDNELAGVRVAAMNVKKLNSDNRNPARYRKRLDTWRDRVTQSGATGWNVILEPPSLVAYLDAGRM